MPMTTAYLNLIATAGAAAITHIALVNGSGTELTGGSYARKPVTWAAASNGVVRPSADLTFDVPAGAVVAGWKGYTALTGGTDHGGGTFASAETFAGAGQYVVTAASSGISHTAA